MVYDELLYKGALMGFLMLGMDPHSMMDGSPHSCPTSLTSSININCGVGWWKVTQDRKSLQQTLGVLAVHTGKTKQKNIDED